MTTVLVTGATGTIGRRLAQHLLAMGASVRCLTRDRNRADLPSGVEIAEGDLRDPGSLGPACEGVDAAHLITFAGDAYAPIEDGEAIVSSLAQAGATRVTLLVGDSEESPLERAAKRSDLEWTALIPVEFMANMLDWAAGARLGRVEEGFADVPSTVVHESDVASVAAHVLLRGGEHERALWITGPEALTVRERVRIIAEATGNPLTLIALSEAEVQRRWREYGYSEDDISYMTGVKTEPPLASRVPTDTVHRVTGRAPHTFSAWAEEHVREFMPASRD